MSTLTKLGLGVGALATAIVMVADAIIKKVRK